MTEAHPETCEEEPISEVEPERASNKIIPDKTQFLSLKNKNRLDMIYHYKPGKTISIYLEDRIAKFCQHNKIKNINISLFGFVSSGKSTLINRVSWFIDKKPWSENIVAVRQIDFPEYRRVSLTTERTQIFIRDGIAMIDNRGFTEITMQVLKEIQRQCEGKIAPDVHVANNWDPNLKSSFCRKIVCRECPKLEWATNCPVIVYRLDDERDPDIFQEVIDAIYMATIVAITFKIEMIYNTKFKSTKPDGKLLELLHVDPISKTVAQFHQMHCGRICLIPINTLMNEQTDLESFESIALIDFLFNCCCVADLHLKKTMLSKETPVCC